MPEDSRECALAGIGGLGDRGQTFDCFDHVISLTRSPSNDGERCGTHLAEDL